MKCSVRNCKGQVILVHLGKPLCECHWLELCNEENVKRAYDLSHFLS